MTTEPTQQEQQVVEEYFIQLLQRYDNMNRAGVDPLGYKRAVEMCQRWLKRGKITPGEFQYIWDRTHPHGKYSNYMKNNKYKKYGEVPLCPARIISQNYVDWSIAHDREFREKTQGPNFGK